MKLFISLLWGRAQISSLPVRFCWFAPTHFKINTLSSNILIGPLPGFFKAIRLRTHKHDTVFPKTSSWPQTEIYACFSQYFPLLSFLLKTYFYFMCMGALPTCVSVQHMHAVPKEPRRKCPISWTWVRDNCKLSCKAGNPLKQQQMFLTSKPSLQP